MNIVKPFQRGKPHLFGLRYTSHDLLLGVKDLSAGPYALAPTYRSA